MTPKTVRAWSVVHTWSSLISTVFLVMLCLTGLPLIFHHEIEDWVAGDQPRAVPIAEMASLDAMVDQARAANPGRVISGVFINPDAPQAVVYSQPSWQALVDRPFDFQATTFDSRTGQLAEGAAYAPHPVTAFMDLMLRLHVDMFLLLPGQLFLGAMGVLFLVAIVSGVVLYGPFTRKLKFGEIRREKTRRTRWLDLHNLLGAVTIVWASVVGFTGALNELAGPLYQNYVATDVAAVARPWQGQPAPPLEQQASVDTVVASVGRAMPDQTISFVSLPGNPFGSSHHYFIWTHGQSGLNSRMDTPALADAVTGKFVSSVPMPWYIQAIEISRPLHFGDYGGMPLKILWALMTIVTLIVLISGLYLWIARKFLGVKKAARAPRYEPDALPAAARVEAAE